MLKYRFLVLMTGSIACYKVCELISRLVKEGHTVKVAATPSALKFVGESTLEGLTGSKVYSKIFENGQMMSHIHLTRWADALIIAPATAHSINKLSQGSGDDLVSTLLLATESWKPKFLAPAMNVVMFNQPSVQESLKKLEDWGYHILPSESGNLACGETGEGRLMEPEKIYSEVKNTLEKIPQEKLKVLITSGGTKEPIDPVRYIANFSTGQTGAAIADSFYKAGAHVTLLHAKDAILPEGPVQKFPYQSFNDLNEGLQKLLSQISYDVVIHSAAVSDFSVESPSDQKLSSEKSLTIKLKNNFKIIERLKEYSKNKKMKVVAFKLTAAENPSERMAAVEKLLSHPHIDMLIHNDMTEISKENHKFTIYGPEVQAVSSKTELAQELAHIFTHQINSGETL